VQTGDVYAQLPPNLIHLSITDTTGLVDITQTAADKIWGTAARVLTANTNLANLEVDLTKIHGTAITETSGQIAAAFTKLFDVAVPVLTCESVNQAQDNATTAEIKTALEAGGGTLALSKTILDKVDSMTVLDGAVYQLTANSLELAPTGGAAPTADQIAAKILKTPANLLVTDTAGRVTPKNRSL
jgi:hypothetical protein